jgi:hypothetical protein
MYDMYGILNYAKKYQYLKRNANNKLIFLVDVLKQKLHKKTALIATT